jgi:alkylation response protein AidB-like acyl-CoA dehydrogenase
LDLAFSPEDLAFQQEVRDWIATAFDDDLRRKVAQSKNGYLDKAGQVKWQKRLFERGWAAPDWPVELGGAGFTPRSATSSTWSCRWPARPIPRRWG